MIPAGDSAGQDTAGAPRASGDDPFRGVVSGEYDLCSPRERG